MPATPRQIRREIGSDLSRGYRSLRDWVAYWPTSIGNSSIIRPRFDRETGRARPPGPLMPAAIAVPSGAYEQPLRVLFVCLGDFHAPPGVRQTYAFARALADAGLQTGILVQGDPGT